MSSCRISFIQDQAVVRNENGKESNLYKEILNYNQGDQEASLNMFAMTTTSEFMAATGVLNKNDEVDFETVKEYFEQKYIQEQKPLSPSEEIQLIDIARNAGMGSLSELHSSLKKITTPTLNVQAAIESNLYSEAEVKNIDIDLLTDIVGKLEKTIAKQDITFDNNFPTEYKDTGKTTIIGTFAPINEEDIFNEVVESIEDFSSEEEILSKIAELPYTDFVQEFNTDKGFRDDFIQRLKAKKRVPQIAIGEEGMITEGVDEYNTISNTLITGQTFTDVEVLIDNLEALDEQGWQETLPSVQKLLEKIESRLASRNIDVIGISKTSEDRTNTLQFLGALKSFLTKLEDDSLSQKDMQDFAVEVNKKLSGKKATVVLDLDANIRPLTVVQLESELSDAELFEKHGLISIGENLYQKVNKETTKAELYEYLYTEVSDGRLKIPSEQTKKETKDILKKQEVLEDIKKYILGRNVGMETTDNELLSLFQVVFQHPEKNIKDTQVKAKAKIGSITKNNHEYLRTDFISDFYQFVLKEKLANTPLYNKTLSKFKFTDKGISLKENIETLHGIPQEVREDLENYIRLRKDSHMDYLVSNPQEATSGVTVVNLPNTIKEYAGKASIEEGYVITEPNFEDIIKVGGNLYKKKNTNDLAHLYAPVVEGPDNVYYNPTPKVRYDKNTAKKVLSKYNKKVGVKTTTEEAKQQAGLETTFMQKLKNASKKIISAFQTGVSEENTDAVFNKNLIEFLRQKGVDVITDKKEVQRVLKESGYTDIMAAYSIIYEEDADGKNNKGIRRTTAINVSEKEDVITVTHGLKNSKVRTYAQAVRIADNIRDRLIEKLKEDFGNNYAPGFVYKPTATTVRINIPQGLKENYRPPISEQEYDLIVAMYTKKEPTDFEKEIIREMRRGVSPKDLKDLGYNFLQTPQGNILGFEKDGKIYLDENQLNTTTTIHELIHVFQSMLDIKAKKGDKQAQDIIAKRKELFGDIAQQWKEFHNNKGNIGIGALNINTIIDIKNQQIGNKLPLKISKEDLYEKVKNFENINFDSIFDTEKFKELIPNIDISDVVVKFIKDDKRENYGGASVFHTGNKIESVEIYFNETEISKGDDYIRKAIIRRISHETQHLYDMSTGRNFGGSVNNIAEKISKAPRGVQKILENIDKESGDKNFSAHEGVSTGIYLALAGENRARLNELQENGIIDEENNFNVEVPQTLQIENQEGIDKIINNLKPEVAEYFYALGRYYYFSTKLPESTISFNILGEQGAANLDAVEEGTRRLDNLQIAREMEEAGKTPLEIRLATEWEKGADGKWKYEVDTNMSIKTFEINRRTIGDIIDYPELFKAFPEIKDVVVRVFPFDDVAFDGKYNPELDEIHLSSYLIDEDDPKNLIFILSHELQHKVQYMEGWNPMSEEDIKNYVAKSKNIGLYNPYSDVEDDSVELATDIIEEEFRRKGTENLEEVLKSTRNADFIKLVSMYLDFVGYEIQEGEVIAGNGVTIDNKRWFVEGGRYPATKEGLLTALNDSMQDIATRNSVESLEAAEKELSETQDKKSERALDLVSTISVLKQYTNNIETVKADNFIIDRTTKSITEGVISAYKKYQSEFEKNLTEEGLIEGVTKLIEDMGADEFDTYFKAQSEVEARTVQERMPMSLDQRRQTLLSETEDVAREDQIVLFNLIGQEQQLTEEAQQLKDTIGFDLSSPVYAQRANESNEEWAERLEKEVEAYLTAPEVAKKLDNLQKENPSLWQKIMDFIANLKNWLKGQIGLSDYKGDIMDMTKEEYVSALGISVLKDDYAKINAIAETRDGAPIGFNYDTDKVARERFDISKLTKIGEGSDRVVFDLGDNKVLKVAKTARGLEQNMYESDFYLSLLPKTFEMGLNYVVKENIPRAKNNDVIPIYDTEDGSEIGESTIKEMLSELSRFDQEAFDKHNGELEKTLSKYGLQDVLNYSLLYNDFTALRNWGYDAESMTPLHIDGGTFAGVKMLDKFRGKKNLQDEDFREVYFKSRQVKKEYQDKDKYTMFQTQTLPSNSELKEGLTVNIEPRTDKGALVSGEIAEILTKTENHPYGILVRLKSGEEGRVKAIVGDTKKVSGGTIPVDNLKKGDLVSFNGNVKEVVHLYINKRNGEKFILSTDGSHTDVDYLDSVYNESTLKYDIQRASAEKSEEYKLKEEVIRTIESLSSNTENPVFHRTGNTKGRGRVIINTYSSTSLEEIKSIKEEVENLSEAKKKIMKAAIDYGAVVSLRYASHNAKFYFDISIGDTSDYYHDTISFSSGSYDKKSGTKYTYDIKEASIPSAIRRAAAKWGTLSDYIQNEEDEKLRKKQENINKKSKKALTPEQERKLRRKAPRINPIISNLFENKASAFVMAEVFPSDSKWYPLIKELSTFKKSVGDITLEWMKTGTTDNDGTYDRRNNIISQNPKSWSAEETITHEFVHGVTVKAIKKVFNSSREGEGYINDLRSFIKENEKSADELKKSVANIGKLYLEAAEKYGEMDKLMKYANVRGGRNLSKYGFVNLLEFTAETIADEDFQKTLNNIPTENGIKTIFTKFIELISDLMRALGGKGVASGSILEAAISETAKIMRMQEDMKTATTEQFRTTGAEPSLSQTQQQTSNSLQAVLDNQIEVLSLFKSEEEENQVYEKIDSCGI